MTTKLSDEDRKSLILYRLQRADETITEAEYNARGGYYNTAVNRLYYAAYYATIAVMLSRGLDATTHTGVKAMLSLHFIKAGIISPKYGRIFMSLFENRQSGDYEDFVYCDNELFSYLLPQAKEYIEIMKSLIN